MPLLMISLTSINTVYSSSKWSQKNKWLQEKKKGGRAPAPFFKFASACGERQTIDLI